MASFFLGEELMRKEDFCWFIFYEPKLKITTDIFFAEYQKFCWISKIKIKFNGKKVPVGSQKYCPQSPLWSHIRLQFGEKLAIAKLNTRHLLRITNFLNIFLAWLLSFTHLFKIWKSYLQTSCMYWLLLIE